MAWRGAAAGAGRLAAASALTLSSSAFLRASSSFFCSSSNARPPAWRRAAEPGSVRPSVARCRPVPRPLPVGNHLARAAAERTVGVAGGEAECRQRDLDVLVVEHRQPQAALARLGDLLRRLIGLALRGGVGSAFCRASSSWRFFSCGVGIGLLASLVLLAVPAAISASILRRVSSICLRWRLLARSSGAARSRRAAGQFLLVLQPLASAANCVSCAAI